MVPVFVGWAAIKTLRTARIRGPPNSTAATLDAWCGYEAEYDVTASVIRHLDVVVEKAMRGFPPIASHQSKMPPCLGTLHAIPFPECADLNT
jgi:hypothetical protein